MTPAMFLLDELPLGDDVLLVGEEGHHAARVRRVAIGEHVQITDGVGTLLSCTVQRVIGGEVHLTVADRVTVPLPEPRLVAVQALPKGERAELAVETMTELGVDEIVPWAASRSVVQWFGARGDKSLERWRRTAREAAKQSRRPRLPVVSPLVSTAQVAARIGAAHGLVLHEDATDPIATVTLPGAGEIVVVIGPEGGVAPDELTAFQDAGASVVRLGAPVLRTSTAGAAALSALSVRLGRWG